MSEPPNPGKQSPELGSQSLFSPKILEAVPDAMVAVDHDGKILHVNAQAEALFGYSRDALIGQPIELLVPERYRGRHQAHRVDYVEDRRSGAWEPVSISTDDDRMARGFR
jgi:PAS domain S-box-containing protein